MPWWKNHWLTGEESAKKYKTEYNFNFVVILLVYAACYKSYIWSEFCQVQAAKSSPHHALFTMAYSVS